MDAPCSPRVQAQDATGEIQLWDEKEVKKLGKIIRRTREEKGITLTELVERGYSSYQHWQRVESGDRNITYITLLNICRVLEVTPAELLKNVRITI